MMHVSLLRLCLLAFVAVASAQFGGKRPPKPKAPVNKGDLKYIRCQVCEAMAKQSLKAVKDLAEAAAPKKVREADILEKLEKMCDPDQDEGDWITQFDIVEEKDTLQLRDTGRMGKCKSECRTIARACDTISEDIDLTDLSAMLYKGKKRSAVSNWMCHESSDACSKKTPPVPKGRPAGETHEPMDEDEVRSAKMLRSMKAQGMSGTMYNKETMREELAEMAEEYGDDPDFARLIADTGLDAHMPNGGDSVPEPDSATDATGSSSSASASVADAAADVAAKWQKGAAKAAAAAKEGAAKLQETVKEQAAKLQETVKEGAAKLQESASKLQETVKEGATKAVESARALVNKWLGGSKKGEL